MISLLRNFSFLKIVSSTTTPRLLQSSASYSSQFKARDRRELLRTVGKIDEGVEGESVVSLDAVISSREDMFTDEKTPNLLFGGVPFREIPIINLKITKNNTKVTLVDYKGKIICRRSAGMEGFKHCRKGTNVAGQSTGLTVSAKAKRLGITDVRVKIQGLGPGRLAAIKGIEMGGLNIISLTDDTRISFRPSYRPRKAKRL